MNNKRNLLLTVSTLTLSSLGAFNDADALAILPTSGNNDVITALDTWDINLSAGAVDANIRYNNALGGASLTVTDSLAGSGTANIGSITLKTDNGAHKLNVGNGITTVNLIVNGEVFGNNTTNDLNISVNASLGSASSTITFLDDVDLGSGVITLNSSTTSAIAAFAGSMTQIVTGKIKGDSAAEGDIVITNSSAGGVTFTSAIGETAIDTITIGSASQGSSAIFNSTVVATKGIYVGQDGTSSSATFKNDVTVETITLGSGITNSDTNTVTFDSTNNNVTVSHSIVGSNLTDTNNIIVTGGANKVTLSTSLGNNIDNITVNSNSDLELTNGTVSAAAISLASGSILTNNSTAENITSTTFTGSGAILNIGDGDDDNLSGTITGSSGIDTLNVNSTSASAIGGDADFAGGNDLINVQGGATFLSAIDGGDDNDILNVSSGTNSFAGAISDIEHKDLCINH